MEIAYLPTIRLHHEFHSYIDPFVWLRRTDYLMLIRGSDWQLYVSLSNKKVGSWIINKFSVFDRQNLLKHESQWRKNDDSVLGGEEVGVRRCVPTFPLVKRK